jgi:AcrR family transcriptional regulator
MWGMATRVNRRGAARRQALIDAAVELWAATGWRGTGITAVAERAGITPAGLLHHFGTKEDFLLAVLAELDTRTLAYWDAQGPHLGLDAIRLLPEVAGGGEQQQGLWKLHVMLQAENLDPDGPAYDYYVLRQRFLHDRFATAIRTGQQHDEIRPDADPDLIATQIIAFLQGLQLHREHGPQPVDVVATSQDFADRLVRDLTHSNSLL